MSKTEDISRLDRSIKDAEIRIRTIITNIDALSKEITILSDKESTLLENVKCLKKRRIIAVAQEFKKSKDELEKIRARITVLSNDREYCKKTSIDMQSFIHKTQLELDKLQNASDNNVLQFNRGNKDGQE